MVDEDIVEEYKYLGVQTDSKLDWVKNHGTLQESLESLYFLM